MIKCQKCSRSAVVHLTEIVTAADGAKRTLEKHFCFAHAVEANLISAGHESPQKLSNIPSTPPEPDENATAIIPAEPSGKGLIVRKDPTAIRPTDAQACPVCGITWQQFKQGGLMGCPHDYTVFAARIAPLIKRAQENFSQHAGKVPQKIRHSDPARKVALARLNRELQQALERENYEQAASLRDQLKTLS